MKIALVSFRNDSSCPPLGLVQLGTFLQSKGYKVDILDCNWKESPMAYYDIVGISAMTKDYGLAIELAKGIKKRHPIPIIIGGVHISTCPESMNDVFNVGIQGEGEQAFLDTLSLPNLAALRGVVVKSKPVSNIDELPLPNWDLVDKRYFARQPNTTWGRFCSEGVMLTSRGCPYNCVFCSTQAFWGNKVRFHSPAYVEQLVKGLVERGVTHIQVWDDLFALNIPRLNDIADRIRKYNVSLNCQPRANLMTDEMCKALKNVGVKTCIFGFESGSPKILSYLKKDTVTVEQNYNAIRQCRKHSLGVQGSVIFGSPGEVKGDMLRTVDFIKHAFWLGAQRIWGFVLTPFPATQVWENWLSKFEPTCLPLDKKTSMKKRVGDDWARLSHQNTQPYFGDFTLQEFKQVMRKVRFWEGMFRMRKVLMFLRNSPIETIVWGLKSMPIIGKLWSQNV